MDEEVKKKGIDKRFIWGLMIIAVIVGIYFFAFDDVKMFSPSVNGDGEIDSVKARVNGVDVFGKDVERVKEIYETQIGQAIDESVALDKVVEDILIMGEVKSREIEVSFEETEEKISLIIGQQGLSIEDLKEQDKNYDAIAEMYREQLKVEKLALEVTKDVEEVSDVEVLDFYNRNKNELFGEEIPEYNLIKDELKSYMNNEKKREVFVEFVDGLKESAEIEYFE